MIYKIHAEWDHSSSSEYDQDQRDKACPFGIKRINTLNGPDIANLDPVSVQSTDLNAWLRSASIDGRLADLAGTILVFDSLESSIVGNTDQGVITLDNNAADHGWFIDATPGGNEEFLPTSNPNVWVARPGSAAEGKMDMLSVLMHEYGHVLGLDQIHVI